MNRFKNQRGFTLIELLIYMGILSMMIGILTSLFSASLDTRLESQATAAVDQDGRFIIARLTHDFHSAETIDEPSVVSNPVDTLQLIRNPLTYTYSLDNGNLVLSDGTYSDILNSSGSEVSDLTFTRLGTGAPGGTDDTIQIKFRITSKAVRAGAGPEVRDFQTTLAL